MSKMYGISCLLLNTNSTLIEKTYTVREDACKNLKRDAKNFLLKHHNGSKIKTIYKKKNIKESNGEGFYLKVSNKNMNNLCVYQKETIVSGYFYTSKEIKVHKTYIFSVIEIPAPVQMELNVSIPLSCEAILSNYMFESETEDNEDNEAEADDGDCDGNENGNRNRTQSVDGNGNKDQIKQRKQNSHDDLLRELREYLSKRRRSIIGKQ